MIANKNDLFCLSHCEQCFNLLCLRSLIDNNFSKSDVLEHIALNCFASGNNYRDPTENQVFFFRLNLHESLKFFLRHGPQSILIKPEELDLIVDDSSLLSDHNLVLVEFPSLSVLLEQFYIITRCLIFLHLKPGTFVYAIALFTDNFDQRNVTMKVRLSNQILDVMISPNVKITEVKVHVHQDILLTLGNW